MSKPISFRLKSQIEPLFLEEAKREICTYSELLNRILVERYKNRLQMRQDAPRTRKVVDVQVSKEKGL
jgi:hypothetical protein